MFALQTLPAGLSVRAPTLLAADASSFWKRAA